MYHDAPVDCMDKKGRTPLFYASKYGSLVDINDLLKNGADVNHTSYNNKTALFKAKTYETVTLLLKYGANVTTQDSKGRTAIEYLMKYNSDCPTAILDECLIKQPNESLIVDLQVFDSQRGYENKHDLHIFKEAEKQKRSDLFLHPLMQIFMELSYRTYHNYFIVHAIVHLIFTVIFSALGIVYADFTHCTDNGNLSYWKNSKFNSSLVECINNKLVPVEEKLSPVEAISLALDYSQDSWHMYWLYISSHILLVIRLIIEIYKCIVVFQNLKAYVFNFKNVIAMLFLVASFGFIIILHFPIDISHADHFAGWMLFFVWIEFFLNLAKVSNIGRYIIMSTYVMKTMFFILMAYVPCFLAFVGGFYIFLRPSEKFESYTSTFVKVLSMMVGELNYDNDFSYHKVINGGGASISTQIMFCLFVVSVMVIILNLLIAVTVSNTQSLDDISIQLQTRQKIIDVELASRARARKQEYLRKKTPSKTILETCCSNQNYKVRKKHICFHCALVYI